MSVDLDSTHDRDRVSWLPSAQAPDCEFPIQNLPFGVFQRPGEDRARVGTAIG